MLVPNLAPQEVLKPGTAVQLKFLRGQHLQPLYSLQDGYFSPMDAYVLCVDAHPTYHHTYALRGRLS